MSIRGGINWDIQRDNEQREPQREGERGRENN
jgi:hypothetical protein